MRRFLIPFLLVFTPCIIISATIHAQTILFSSDFEAGMVGWQTKHLLPGDGIKCRGENCFFEWSATSSVNRRLIRAAVGYTGNGGQLISLSGNFTVKPGATLYLRMSIPGQKTRCKRIVKPTLAPLERFTCASTAGVSFTQIMVKISSTGGGKVRADDVTISVK
jgi:hypothetical protein